MGVNYPITNKAIDSLQESADYRLLLNSIVELTNNNKSLLSLNGMKYRVNIEVEPNIYNLCIDSSNADGLANVLIDQGGSNVIPAESIDGNPELHLSAYEAMVTNRFLIGRARILTEGVFFSDGSVEGPINKIIRFYSSTLFYRVQIEFTAGFNNFILPKSALVSYINKTSYANLVLGNNYSGNSLTDLNFSFLEDKDWEYTCQVSLVDGFGISDFNFLPYLDEENNDSIQIGDDFYKVLAVHGKLFKLDRNITGDFEVKVIRKLGQYKKSYLSQLQVSDKLSGDLPMSFLPENNDYRLSVYPLVFTAITAVRNALQLHLLGTDSWSISGHSEELSLSKLNGTGHSIVTVDVPANMESAPREFYIDVSPTHALQNIRVFIQQLAETFNVAYSWVDKHLDDKAFAETLTILATMNWSIAKSPTSVVSGSVTEDDPRLNWVTVTPTSGVGTAVAQTVSVEISKPVIPYTSWDTERQLFLIVTPELSTVSPVSVPIIQHLNPVLDVVKAPDLSIGYLGDSILLILRTNFKINISGLLSDTFTPTGLDTKAWTAKISPNHSDTDKTYVINIKTAFDDQIVRRFSIVQESGGSAGIRRQPSEYKVHVNYTFREQVASFTVKVIAIGSTTYAWDLLINIGNIPYSGKLQGKEFSGAGTLNYTIQFGGDSPIYEVIVGSTSDFEALWKKDVFSIYRAGNSSPEILNPQAKFDFTFGVM